MQHRLGLIAGGGILPAEIIKFCVTSERPFLVIAIKNQTHPDIVSGDTPHKWFRMGAAGTIIEFLKTHEVKDLVMAGTMKRPSIFSLCPDLFAIKFFLRTGASFLGDNGLLSNLTQVLHEEGFNVIAPNDLLPELVASKGSLGLIEPNERDKIDITAGIKAALEIGRQDLGQAAIARNGEVIGTEDNKGTDFLLSTIKPCKDLSHNGVLVKVAKPGQEIRADLPTIGPLTVSNAVTAGLSGIAIQSGMSLILDQRETLKLANDNGIFIFGVNI